MTNRNERRLNKKALGKNVLNHPAVKRVNPNFMRAGRGAAREGNDQILDGAHTHVAIALAAVSSGRAGQGVPVPAYLLQPDQWRRFVIPSHIAKALNFDATLDRDDRTWSTPGVTGTLTLTVKAADQAMSEACR